MTLEALTSTARFGAGLGLVTGALVGALEALVLLALPGGAERVPSAAGAFVLSATVGSVLGALLALWLTAATNGTARLGRFRASVTSFLASLPLQAFFAWVPTNWIVSHWQELPVEARAVAIAVYAAVPVLLTAATWFATRIHARYRAQPGLPGFHFPLLAASTLIALASYFADLRVLVGLYDEFHYGLAVTALFSAALGVLLTRVTLIRTRAWPRLESTLRRARVPMLVGFPLVLVALDLTVPQAFDPRGTATYEKELAVLRALSDLDGDGASNILGGLDCAAFDERVAPGAFDLPENGTDENCTGQDAQWPKPRAVPHYEAPPRKRYNVLLVTVDALRADHVGAYGYGRETTPHLDELARRSLLFRRAFAQSPKTFFSLPSLHTGRYPPNITRDYDHPKVRKRKGYAYHIGSDVPTLAEAFDHAGYATLLVSRLRMLGDLGLARGVNKTIWTRDVARETTSYLAKVKEPFFAWVHLLDPHDPYEKQPGHDFGDSELDRYDSEIAGADAALGEIQSSLGERQQDTVVIVTADHGEAFGEHGLRFHPQELYSELLHVPLVLSVPQAVPGEVSTVVELVDLYPTLCELTPIELGCARTDGETLLAAGVRSTRFGGAYATAIHPDGRTLRTTLAGDSFRFIQDTARDRMELYDLKTDPGELHSVAGQHRSLVLELVEELDVRPLRRQAELVRRFRKTGDIEDLTAHLDAFHEDEVLEFVLDQVPEEPPTEVRRALHALHDRPGTSEALKRRIRELVPEQNDGAKRPRKGKKKKKKQG